MKNKYIVVGINRDGLVSPTIASDTDKEKSIQRAGQLAATSNPNCVKGYAVYECIGMAIKPEIPVNFVTIESMEK